MTYSPRPIQTKDIQLGEDLQQLVELLAENVHEQWAARRLMEGWTYGDQRNNELKQHPGLVAYGELSEQEKDYDRTTAVETLKVILQLGYRITAPEKETGR
ncbi:RyR domain-containing protein [Paenibacillus kobensis]|uniref:RyR domain-containing protein n=1 Tax=Paenibacillus kobensis TaxID=59841 RepID=UPI000FDB8FDC|nr:RyR domain-containing protein [Paenibacillus kobensis]